ncbi:hypothetical protein RA307_06290 [Xanthobacteraceae bacterium Astr-EGSB]|uniref:hypothetical protein n=1 Tax=Astrobacterium formosum TaxID=3069710 RepID=UPI0027B60CFC|nr:hypothetical protein [Xanthobacteraceae bacterium Astr-EGSB]
MTNLLDNLKLPVETKPALWGAIAGAIALGIVASTWGGWVSGATADQRAKDAADKAVVVALAPICVDKFQHQADADTRLAELKKVSSWQQGSFIEKGGWATLPGQQTPQTSVARACADILNGQKL